MERSIVLVRLSLSYGFMTTICPYMGIPRYGHDTDDVRDLHMGIKGSPTITDASSSIYGDTLWARGGQIMGFHLQV